MGRKGRGQKEGRGLAPPRQKFLAPPLMTVFVQRNVLPRDATQSAVTATVSRLSTRQDNIPRLPLRTYRMSHTRF